jgi:hypothetical protein
MTHNNQPGAPRGRRVIEEAGQLLGQLRFSDHRGAYAEGARVAVSVDPRWNTDQETFRTLITCYPFGHRWIDWATLPVHVQPEGGVSRVSAFARLNWRGQVLIPHLPAGEYRLSLRLKPVQATPVLSRRLERLAAKELGEETMERQVWRGTGEDNAIVWTLEETEEGEVQIAFETDEERFADRTVMFYLIDPISGQVQYSQRLQLAPTRTPGKWEGWCAIGFRADFQGPYELVFEVTSPDADA